MASLHSALLDLRIALRILRKSPGATALCVVSLSLGIGLTAGLFSVGDAMLLRAMPFRQPDRLLSLTSWGDDGKPFQYGWLDYLDIAEAARGRADFAAYQRRGIMLATGDTTVNLLVNPVTPNYFSLLGVTAGLGRASVEP